MGVHICLYTQHIDGYIVQVPEEIWDFIRYGNDREFASKLYNITNRLKLDYEYWRPINVDDILPLIDMSWENHDRYLHFYQLLKDNDDYWIYLSY